MSAAAAGGQGGPWAPRAWSRAADGERATLERKRAGLQVRLPNAKDIRPGGLAVLCDSE